MRLLFRVQESDVRAWPLGRPISLRETRCYVFVEVKTYIWLGNEFVERWLVDLAVATAAYLDVVRDVGMLAWTHFLGWRRHIDLPT